MLCLSLDSILRVTQLAYKRNLIVMPCKGLEKHFSKRPAVKYPTLPTFDLSGTTQPKHSFC